MWNRRLRSRMNSTSGVSMAKEASPRAGQKSRRRRSRSVPIEQVSPAVLTATRDVAFTLDQLGLDPDAEDVLKAVLERAEHLEEQASGITVIDD